MVSEKIKEEKKRINTPKNKKILKYVLYFLLGLAFSAGRVLTSLHPFCASAVCASKKKYLLFSSAGAVIGSLIFGVDVYSLRYMSAVLFSALLSFGIIALDLDAQFFSIFSAFLSILVTGIVVNIRLGENSAAYLLVLAESILSGGGAFFLRRALNSDYKRLRLRALGESDIACIVISFSLLIMNLSQFKIFHFTPVRILAVLAVLLAIRFLGGRRGLIIAVSFGFSLGISGGDSLFVTGAFAFSALAAYLFCALSSLASGISFLCSFAFFCIASESDIAFDLFVDAAAGTALFLLLPPGLASRLETLCGGGLDLPSDGSLRQSLVLKLRFAGAAMKAISESVEQVSERIDEITRSENKQLRDKISSQEYAAREIVLEKTNQIRRVASDQFFSIADMLDDLALEFDKAEIFDASASSKIRRFLGEYEVYPQSVSVVEDKFKRIRVEILLDSFSSRLESPEVKKEIGKICSRYFDDPQVTNFKDETMLSFNERANYSLETGYAQHSAQGRLCGDTVKIINDGRGHAILIISDGMGTGSRAALDGAMGAGLLSRLINAGFGFDSALKVVNCALLVKSNDESLATLDIANIDLFTGKCELLKSGAPASYIIKGKSVTKCELFSMPAGILRGIEFAKRTAVLTVGDRIIIMSDGIAELGDDRLYPLFDETGSMPCRKAAAYILEKALDFADKDKLDDMSVIVARLKNNN